MTNEFSERERNKPIASQEVLERLRQEADILMDAIAESDPSVGDAVFMSYDEKFARRQGIGRFGRMTLEDGTFECHAAPMEIDRRPAYIMPDYDLFDYVKKWMGPEKAEVPIDKMLAGPPPPKIIHRPKNYDQKDYEKEIFRSVASRLPLTLVNPSFSTMATALNVVANGQTNGVFVLVKAPLDKAWGADIRNFVANSSKGLKMVSEAVGISYLGAGLPKYYPPTNWFRLILSPSVDPQEQFEKYSVEMKEDCFMSRYEKKEGYIVTSVLQRDASTYIYNPETVDASFMGKEAKRVYFLETTAAWSMETKDNRALWHSPFFITMQGTWQRFGTLQVRSQGNLIYDAKVDYETDTTYLSRRQRLEVPGEMTWAPLQSSGTHWITYSSTKPHKDYNVQPFSYERQSSMGDWAPKTKTDALLFGLAFPVTGLKKIEAPGGTVFVSKVRPPSTFVWPLDSADLSLALLPLPDHYSDLYYDAFMDDKGRVYSELSKRDDALIFQAWDKGQQVLPGLPKGRIKYTERFVREDHSYVVMDKLFAGSNFVFAKAVDIQALLPSVTMYTGKWFSTRSLLTSSPDPQWGGQMSISRIDQEIDEIMNLGPIIHPYVPGMTARRISDQLGVSSQFIFNQLAANPKYILWRQGTGTLAQFVSVPDLQLRFKGGISDHEMGFLVNGRTWGEVIQHLAYSTKVYSSDVIPMRFLEILGWNGFKTSYQDKGVYKVLHVKIPKR